MEYKATTENIKNPKGIREKTSDSYYLLPKILQEAEKNTLVPKIYTPIFKIFIIVIFICLSNTDKNKKATLCF